MKSYLLACLLLVTAVNSFASNVIQIGHSSSLTSNILNEQRPYHVYLPPSYTTSDNSYPVIYFLDGDEHRFKGFVGMLESLSTDTLERQVNEAIVIAIPNTDRVRDLTPTVLNEWTFKGRVLDTFSATGNADRFASFFAKELIPHIESRYRTSSTRILVGESFGGLFAAHVLLHNPAVFSDFLIIDPTALWDNDYLNRTFQQYFLQTTFDADVFFAFANNAHLHDIGLTNYQWGNTFASSVIDKAGSHSEKRYFENESHGTVALLAWYHGLKSLLANTDQ